LSGDHHGLINDGNLSPGDVVEQSQIFSALLMFGVLVFSLSLHEFGHAYAAYRLGDPTAKMLGRLTLDPRAHADLMGTVVFPLVLLLSSTGFLFGWAKPVPVTVENLRDARRDGALVAFAGPAMNLLLAFLSMAALFLLSRFAPPLGLDPETTLTLWRFLRTFLLLNVILAVFNLIPVHPLDGSWILKAVLPPEWSYKVSRLDPYGFPILAILVLTGVTNFLFGPAIFVVDAVLGALGAGGVL
jgi:Zn-dependent protease